MVTARTDTMRRNALKTVRNGRFSAVLGKANGTIYSTTRKGYTWVRKIDGIDDDGNPRYTEPFLVADGLGTSFYVYPGAPVVVKWDEYDKLWYIERNDFNSLAQSGINPSILNPSNPWREATNPFTNAPYLLSHPIATSGTPTMEVSVHPLMMHDATGSAFAFENGAKISLASDVPSSGEHRLALVWLKIDGTLDTSTSTVKSQSEPLTVTTDAYECLNNPPGPRAIPSKIYRLYGDQTTVVQDDVWMDVRMWINAPDVKTNFAGTAAPTTGDDVDDNYEAGSFWIDTTNDNAYVCLDNSSGAAVWGQINGGGTQGVDSGGTGVDNSSAENGGIAAKISGTEIKVVHTPLAENILLNPDFLFAEDTNSVTGIGSEHICTITRFSKSGTSAVFDASQDTDVPTVAEAGRKIPYSLKIDTTTGDASVSAGDIVYVNRRIHGYRFANMAAERPLVLRFWIKSDITGTICTNLRNSGGDRSFMTEHTIDATGTWERKSVLIDASPSAGTWNLTSGVGLHVNFIILAGSTWQGTADSWQTGSYFATSNQTNFAAATNNTLWITGIELIAADELNEIPCRIRDYNEEFDLLLPFYWKLKPGVANSGFVDAHYSSATAVVGMIQYPRRMIANPTFTDSGSFILAPTSDSISSISGANLNRWGARISAVSSGLSSGESYLITDDNDTDAYFEFDARL